MFSVIFQRTYKRFENIFSKPSLTDDMYVYVSNAYLKLPFVLL